MIFSEKELGILIKLTFQYKKELKSIMETGPKSMEVYPEEVELIEKRLRREKKRINNEIPEITDEQKRNYLLKLGHDLINEYGKATI